MFQTKLIHRIPAITKITKRSVCRLSILLKKHGIVPDVVEKAPDKLLRVIYDGVNVDPGVTLTPTQVKHEPLVCWDSDPNAFHTVCLTDPDAPSRQKPTSREWHHWLLVNVCGSRQASGKVLSHYIGAGPPHNTGLHRYVFLVYRQPCELNFDEKLLSAKSAKRRANFSISAFAEKYSMEGPIAANFFFAGWDEYVPKLYKRLGL